MSLRNKSLKIIINSIKNAPSTIQEEILEKSKDVIEEEVQEKIMTETTNLLPELIEEITEKMLNKCFRKNSVEYQFLEPYLLEIAINVAEKNTFIVNEKINTRCDTYNSYESSDYHSYTW